MNHGSLSALVALLLLLPGILCAADDDLTIVEHWITQTEVLAESHFKKEVVLKNGPDIYRTVAGLFDKPGTIEASLDGTTTKNVNLAWESNPRADQHAFSVTLAKGTTVFGGIQRIAKLRKESVTTSRNYLVITSTAKLPLPPRCFMKGKNHNEEVERSTIDLIPAPVAIVIREPFDDDLERFINYKFQETWSLSDKGAVPYKLSVTKEARKKAEAVNLIGTWVYQDLFNAVGQMAGLRWEIDGQTILLHD